MKTMRYLLITFAVMMMSMQVVNAKAQNLAEQPRAEFHTTSSMVWSGSTLPQAAQSGVYTTDENGAGTRANMPGIRRDERPGDWTDPYKDPIGDGLWAMLALAAVYAVFRIRRKCV